MIVRLRVVQSGVRWTRQVLACYPSTDKRGKCLLLCETSLARFLPLQWPRASGFRQTPKAQFHTWNGQASDYPGKARPSEPSQCPTILLPSLELQAHTTGPSWSYVLISIFIMTSMFISQADVGFFFLIFFVLFKIFISMKSRTCF